MGTTFAPPSGMVLRGVWAGVCLLAIAVSCGGSTENVGTSRSAGGSAAGGSSGTGGSGGNAAGGSSGSAGVTGTGGTAGQDARPGVTACETVSDCVIVNAGCCAACEPVGRDTLMAVNAERAAANDYRDPCPGVSCAACPP